MSALTQRVGAGGGGPRTRSATLRGETTNADKLAFSARWVRGRSLAWSRAPGSGPGDRGFKTEWGNSHTGESPTGPTSRFGAGTSECPYTEALLGPR